MGGFQADLVLATQAPSETWIAQKGLFIAIPTQWTAGPDASQVRHDLDWGPAHMHRFAVRLDDVGCFVLLPFSRGQPLARQSFLPAAATAVCPEVL